MKLEVRGMTPQEMLTKLDELYQEQFNLRFQASTRQLANTNRLRQVRREIAQVKTVLREVEQQAEAQ
ncbi:MAG: 50S ribosomal protein L29 [Chloroflexi bacterium]|nr:50S ribosomal protein L29 [Chloroflexota bacterium]